MFDGKAVFIDHAGFFDNPSLRDLIGDTRDSVFTGDSVEGTIEFYNTPDGQVITNLLDELLAQGQHAPDVGLSIVFYPVWDPSPHPSDGGIEGGVRRILDIRHVESIDLVFGPAAEGRLLQALSAIKPLTGVRRFYHLLSGVSEISACIPLQPFTYVPSTPGTHKVFLNASASIGVTLSLVNLTKRLEGSIISHTYSQNASGKSI